MQYFGTELVTRLIELTQIMKQIHLKTFLTILITVIFTTVSGHQSDSLIPLNHKTYIKHHKIKSMKVVLLDYDKPLVHEVWRYDTEGRAIYQKPYRSNGVCETTYDKRDRKKTLKLYQTIDDSLIWISTKHYKYIKKTDDVASIKVLYPDGNKKVTKSESGNKKLDKKLYEKRGDTTVIYDYFTVNNLEKPLPKYKFHQLNDTTTIVNQLHYDKKGEVNRIETFYSVFYSNGLLAETGTYEYDQDEIDQLIENSRKLYRKIAYNDKLYEDYPYPGLRKSKVVENQYKYTEFGRISEFTSDDKRAFCTYNSDHQIVKKEQKEYGRNYRKDYRYNDQGLLTGTTLYRGEEKIEDIEYQYEFYE